MGTQGQNKYFIFSLVLHTCILLVLVYSYHVAALNPVLENTNKNDVISAVILGDTPKSNLLPKQDEPKPTQPVVPVQKPVEPVPSKPQPTIDKNVIALKAAADKKKLQAEEAALKRKKQRDLFAKDLLADIKKHNEKQKKLKQKELQAQFQKTLRDSSEKSLRQQLLNEEIKLQGQQNKQSQGVINKYKALILQAISEHWLVPTSANKSLYCELMIQLAPGGTVLDVQVIKTSGDPALDTSARSAVLKASPLPVPTKSDDFQAFKQFVLRVKPENIVAHENL